jgi:hypothetical protein
MKKDPGEEGLVIDESRKSIFEKDRNLENDSVNENLKTFYSSSRFIIPSSTTRSVDSNYSDYKSSQICYSPSKSSSSLSFMNSLSSSRDFNLLSSQAESPLVVQTFPILDDSSITSSKCSSLDKKIDLFDTPKHFDVSDAYSPSLKYSVENDVVIRKNKPLPVLSSSLNKGKDPNKEAIISSRFPSSEKSQYSFLGSYKLPPLSITDNVELSLVKLTSKLSDSDNVHILGVPEVNNIIIKNQSDEIFSKPPCTYGKDSYLIPPLKWLDLIISFFYMYILGIF